MGPLTHFIPFIRIKEKLMFQILYWKIWNITTVMLRSTGIRIIRIFLENTFRRWLYNRLNTGPLNLKRTRGRWGRRTIGGLFLGFLAWSSIVFRPSSNGNGCRTVHHEHLRAKQCKWRRFLDHLCLLRQKILFEDNRSSVSAFEQFTNFGLSRTILSVVFLITN